MNGYGVKLKKYIEMLNHQKFRVNVMMK